MWAAEKCARHLRARHLCLRSRLAQHPSDLARRLCGCLLLQRRPPHLFSSIAVLRSPGIMTPAFTSRVLASSNRPTNMGPSPPTWHGHAPRQPLSALIGCGTTASFGALVSVGALLSGSGAAAHCCSRPHRCRRGAASFARRVSSPRRLRAALEFTLGTGLTSNCAHDAWCGAIPGRCGASRHGSAPGRRAV